MGTHPRWGTEEFSLSSAGPRIDPDRIADTGHLWETNHSVTGESALSGIPLIQQTLMDLPHARSAAVNSVLHYVLDRHAPSNEEGQ